MGLRVATNKKQAGVSTLLISSTNASFGLGTRSSRTFLPRQKKILFRLRVACQVLQKWNSLGTVVNKSWPSARKDWDKGS